MGAKCVKKNYNLLCLNGYTYVMMLIMDKMWKKPLEIFVDAQDIKAQWIET